MAQQNQKTVKGEWRLKPKTYKLLLTTHIAVSVAWLGMTCAKLVLLLAAVLASTAAEAAGMFAASQVLNLAFPVMAIGTIVSGVILSLGTKWGLLKYYWIVTKIVLSVGVIATAVQLGGKYVQSSITGATTGDWLSNPLTIVIALSVTHTLMLLFATILSTYKPWGKLWFIQGEKGKARVGQKQVSLL